MGLEDLYIITAILGLAVFFIGARVLARYSRDLLTTHDGPAARAAPLLIESDIGTHDGPIGESEQGLTVTFSESGKQYPWDSTKECLLDFIESKGMEVECMCRAGECGSCRTRLIEGEVAYRQAPKINPGDGNCLLCVSVPKTDLVLAR